MSVRLVNGSVEIIPEKKTEVSNWDRKNQSNSSGSIYGYINGSEASRTKALSEIYERVAQKNKFSQPLTDLPHLDYPEYKNSRAIHKTAENDYNYNCEYDYGIDSYVPSDKKDEIKTNGKVDLDFSQGQIGDCWLLSSIQSIRDKKGGQEYLNSLLEYDDKTGNVTVNLKGVGKTYTITPEELKTNNNFSKGDGDVRAIEIACEKYMNETNGTIKKGANSDLAMKMLVGNGQHSMKYKDSFNFNNAKKAYTVSFNDISAEDNYNTNMCAYNASSNSHVKIANNHFYSIVGSDSKYMYLKNPWNTKDLLVVDKISFESYNPSISGAFLPF